MSEYYNLLEIHTRLLNDKGYHETTTGSPNLPGRLFKDLEIQLRIAVEESLRFNEPVDFHIECTTYFPDNPTGTNIELHYSLNAEEGSLDVKKLTVYNQNNMVDYSVHNNQTFPTAKEIATAFNENKLPLRIKKKAFSFQKFKKEENKRFR